MSTIIKAQSPIRHFYNIQKNIDSQAINYKGHVEVLFTCPFVILKQTTILYCVI